MCSKKTSVDDERFIQLCRRIHSRSDESCEDAEHLLDMLEVFDLVRAVDLREQAEQYARALWDCPHAWEGWIEAAKTDSLAWDALRALLRHLVTAHKAGAPIRQPTDALRCLQTWGLEAFTGLCPRQGKRGGDRRKHLLRDEAIVLVLDRLRQLGIPVVYEPSSSAHQEPSGCRMVSDRLPVRIDHIRKMWKKKKSMATRPEAEAHWRTLAGFTEALAGHVVHTERLFRLMGSSVRDSLLDRTHVNLFGHSRSEK